MNKYLFKKLEQAHSSYIHKLGFIAAELVVDSPTKVFEDFFELEPKDICEVLGWRKDKEIFDLIENEIKEESFTLFLYQHDCTGFIAKCYFPEHSNFRFNEDGSFSSCSVHGGILQEFWVYAESIGELIDKICEKADQLFEEQMEEFRNKSINDIEVNIE